MDFSQLLLNSFGHSREKYQCQAFRSRERFPTQEEGVTNYQEFISSTKQTIRSRHQIQHQPAFTTKPHHTIHLLAFQKWDPALDKLYQWLGNVRLSLNSPSILPFCFPFSFLSLAARFCQLLLGSRNRHKYEGAKDMDTRGVQSCCRPWRRNHQRARSKKSWRGLRAG